MSLTTLGTLYTGKLVRLGALKGTEKELIARWSHDADYQRHLHFQPAYPRHVSHFDDKPERDNDPRSVVFAIRTASDDKLIGQTGFWIQWNLQNAWFWIGIGDPDYRGKGYGTDTTELMIGYAFRELNLYRITLGVFGYNERARHTYEKAGFVHEGTQREALYRDGKRFDLHNMGILRPEWEARQAQLIAAAQELTPTP